MPRFLRILLPAILLPACAPSENFVSRSTVDRMPERLNNLHPAMTANEILTALHARNAGDGMGGGPITGYWSSFTLRPGYSLTLVTNDQTDPAHPIEVQLHTPQRTYQKSLRPD